MEIINLATKNEVVGRLKIAGPSMKSFAVEEGYIPDTVRKVVNRYAGIQSGPRGNLAKEILEKLRSRLTD
jgi:hypothetical protein